jgi:thiol:disulfide interchange protein
MLNNQDFMVFSQLLLLLWLSYSLHAFFYRKKNRGHEKNSKILGRTLQDLVGSFLKIFRIFIGKICSFTAFFAFIALFSSIFSWNIGHTYLLPSWLSCCNVEARADFHKMSAASANNIEKRRVAIDFSEEKLQKHIASGGVAIVTVGAEWCMTCKLNDNLVFNNEEIQALLKKHNVLWMKLTYSTKANEAWSFMQKHGRSGIPLNVVYGPAAKNGIVLPEILRKKYIFDALNKASMK